MTLQPGELRLTHAFGRMARAIKSVVLSVASAWARVLESEERRFQKSIGEGGDEPSESAEEREIVTESCSMEESAPSLADIIREKQQKQAPRDFMYQAGDDESE